MADLGRAVSGCSVFDNESGDPFCSFALVRLGEDDAVIRCGRIRDPGLVSVQYPFIAVLTAVVCTDVASLPAFGSTAPGIRFSFPSSDQE